MSFPQNSRAKAGPSSNKKAVGEGVGKQSDRPHMFPTGIYFLPLQWWDDPIRATTTPYKTSPFTVDPRYRENHEKHSIFSCIRQDTTSRKSVTDKTNGHTKAKPRFKFLYQNCFPNPRIQELTDVFCARQTNNLLCRTCCRIKQRFYIARTASQRLSKC